MGWRSTESLSDFQQGQESNDREIYAMIKIKQASYFDSVRDCVVCCLLFACNCCRDRNRLLASDRVYVSGSKTGGYSNPG